MKTTSFSPQGYDETHPDFDPDDPADPALAPAMNVRPAAPRVCANCAHGRVWDGTFFCLRPGGLQKDTGSMAHWLTTCDRWQRHSSRDAKR